MKKYVTLSLILRSKKPSEQAKVLAINTSIDLDLKYFKTWRLYYHGKLIAPFNPHFALHICNATEINLLLTLKEYRGYYHYVMLLAILIDKADCDRPTLQRVIVGLGLRFSLVAKYRRRNPTTIININHKFLFKMLKITVSVNNG